MGSPERDLVAQLLREYLRPRESMSVDQWADRYRVLAGETSAEPGPWRTERTPYLRQIMADLSSDSPHEEVALQFGTQLGKALALDTPIPTPSGWTKMGALQVGDAVFDERGRQCRVVEKSRVYTDHECFAVEFCDGEVIVADAGHRWAIFDRHGRPRIKTTEEIAASMTGQRAAQARVAVASPIDTGADVTLPVDPYVLGAWLGDGNSASAIVTVDNRDSVLGELEGILGPLEVVARNSEHVMAVHLGKQQPQFETRCVRGHDKKQYRNVWQCPTCANLHAKARRKGESLPPVRAPGNGASTTLRALGVLGNKHIPCAYLRASIPQRWALLQGLMDTDGYAQAQGVVEFTSVRECLARQVHELMCSLGLKPRLKIGAAKLYGKEVSEKYRVVATAYRDQPVFRMVRKQSRLRDRADGRARPTETQRRSIVSVQRVASVPVQCISVDAPSHLFLAGRSMIPTHNSESGLNWLGYNIDHDPGPMLLILPTVDIAKRFSKQRLSPMIREAPVLRSKIREARSRDSGNTTLVKEFPGGLLVVTGANSAAGLASMPSRVLYADEVDDYPDDVDGQGEPLGLATARQDTFSRRKRLLSSSPKRPPGFSTIENRFNAGTRYRYHVPCPHCGERQILEWGGKDKPHGLKWIGSDPSTVHYVCRHCGAQIDEHHKPAMLAGGEWIADNPAAPVRSYHLSSLYSPLGWLSWSTIVREFLEAASALVAGKTAPMKTWVNTRLAQTWAEPGARLQVHALRERAQRAGAHRLREVPEMVCALTAGVDVQDNRLEVGVYGWGPGEEVALVDHQVIPGDPAQADLWERLDAYLAGRFRHLRGGTLGIEAVGIDTGGHFTHTVYQYVRDRSPGRRIESGGVTWVQRVFALKGMDRPGMPVKGKGSAVDVNWRGKIIQRGVMLWMVGTNSAKDWWYARLRHEAPGPGFVHVPADVAAEWCEQMTVESRVQARTARGVRMVWACPPGKRNEAWDCAVYALFASHALGLDRYTTAMWERLAERIAPRQADLLSAPELHQDPPAIAPPAQPSVSPAPLHRPARRNDIANSEWSSRL